MNAKKINSALITLLQIIPLLTLVILAYLASKLETEVKSIHRATISNSFADDIIEASAYIAMERGFGALALAGDLKIIPNLKLVMTKSEIRIKKVFDTADNLQKDTLNDRDFIPFEDNRKQVLAIRNELNLLSKRVRQNFSNIKLSKVTPSQWIALHTQYINALTKWRISAFPPQNDSELSLFSNLIVKQKLFIAAEFAGRERGNLGPLIEARKPISADLLKSLLEWRAEVDSSLSFVNDQLSEATLDPTLRLVFFAIRQSFMNDFQEVRQQVYAAKDTGHYPFGAPHWIETSTAAIDTILAASDAVSNNVSQRLDRKSQDTFSVRKNSMLVAGFVGLGSWILTLIASQLMRKKLTKSQNILELIAQKSIEISGLVNSILVSSKSFQELSRSRVVLTLDSSKSLSEIKQKADLTNAALDEIVQKSKLVSNCIQTLSEHIINGNTIGKKDSTRNLQVNLDRQAAQTDPAAVLIGLRALSFDLTNQLQNFIHLRKQKTEAATGLEIAVESLLHADISNLNTSKGLWELSCQLNSEIAVVNKLLNDASLGVSGKCVGQLAEILNFNRGFNKAF